jgi:hypothetical protein
MKIFCAPNRSRGKKEHKAEDREQDEANTLKLKQQRTFKGLLSFNFLLLTTHGRHQSLINPEEYRTLSFTITPNTLSC